MDQSKLQAETSAPSSHESPQTQTPSKAPPRRGHKSATKSKDFHRSKNTLQQYNIDEEIESFRRSLVLTSHFFNVTIPTTPYLPPIVVNPSFDILLPLCEELYDTLIATGRFKMADTREQSIFGLYFVTTRQIDARVFRATTGTICDTPAMKAGEVDGITTKFPRNFSVLKKYIEIFGRVEIDGQVFYPKVDIKAWLCNNLTSDSFAPYQSALGITPAIEDPTQSGSSKKRKIDMSGDEGVESKGERWFQNLLRASSKKFKSVLPTVNYSSPGTDLQAVAFTKSTYGKTAWSPRRVSPDSLFFGAFFEVNSGDTTFLKPENALVTLDVAHTRLCEYVQTIHGDLP